MSEEKIKIGDMVVLTDIGRTQTAIRCFNYNEFIVIGYYGGFYQCKTMDGVHEVWFSLSCIKLDNVSKTYKFE